MVFMGSIIGATPANLIDARHSSVWTYVAQFTTLQVFQLAGLRARLPKEIPIAGRQAAHVNIIHNNMTDAPIASQFRASAMSSRFIDHLHVGGFEPHFH